MAMFLYDLLYGIPAVFLAVAYASEAALFEPAAVLFIAAFIFMLLFSGLVQMKRWLRLIVIVVIPLQIWLGMLIFIEKGRRIPFILGNIEYVWILLISSVTFLLVRLSSRFPLFKVLAALGLFAVLIVNMILRKETSMLTLAFTMLFELLTAAESLRLAKEKLTRTDERTKRYLVCLSPFIVVILPVLLVFKAPEKAYSWDFARRIYADVVTAVDHIQISLFQGSSGSYENAKVGFSEDAVLSGDVRTKVRDVMTVQSSVNEKEQLYLCGKVFGRFDGKNWDISGTSDSYDTTIDILESYGAVLRYDSGHVDDYLRQRTLTLGYRYFNSKHVFHPAKTVIMPELAEELECRFEGGNVIADHRISFKDDYRIRYFRMNRKSSLYGGLLENRSVLTGEEWALALDRLDLDAQEGIFYEDYLAFRSEILRDYSEAPVLTERTKVLLDRLTEGAGTQLERMNRIEAFLQSFDYDVSPGRVPDRIDSAGAYLDYFLFENPKGYCNYFATAMVLLARAEGYPARYVQGYHTDLNKNGQAVIRSDMAHAWAEVYFEGFGWIVFEATPGYHIDSSWTIAAEREAALLEKQQPEGMAEYEMIPMEDIVDLPEDIMPEIPEEEQPDGLYGTAAGLGSAVVILASGAAAAVILLCAAILIKNGRYRNCREAEKLKMMFRRNMTILDQLGLRPGAGETLSEFRTRTEAYLLSDGLSERLKGSAAESTVSDALTFLSDYELFLFAGKPAVVRTVRDAEISNRKLLTVAGRVRGPLMPFIYIRSIFR